MKLYNVPRDSYIRILTQGDHGIHETSVKTPIDSPEIEKGELVKFSHIDGMYSLCYKLDQKTHETQEICHIAAWTEVELVELDEIFGFDKIRQVIGRSGYGKDGKGKYRTSSLKDMSDNWVKASIDYVPKDHPHRKFYKEELIYRQLMNISIPDKNA